MLGLRLSDLIMFISYLLLILLAILMPFPVITFNHLPFLSCPFLLLRQSVFIVRFQSKLPNPY